MFLPLMDVEILMYDPLFCTMILWAVGCIVTLVVTLVATPTEW